MITHEKSLFQKITIPLVCVALSIFLLTFNIVRPRANLLEVIFSYLFYPFQQSAHSVNSVISNSQQYLQLMSKLRRENQAMKKQLESQNYEINRLREGEAALGRLQELLDFRTNNPFEVTAAQVVGVDPSNWYSTIVIDKGRRDGIREKMPVVTHQGVVGQVIKVRQYFSKVLLIMDQRSGIGAMVRRTRTIGVLEGQLGKVALLKYLAPTSEISLNDVVISSGLGGIFPKGLILGTVTRIEQEKTGIYQRVEVSLAVDFARLEEVLVIKNAHLEEVQSLQREED